jgi:hypothetical protein
MILLKSCSAGAALFFWQIILLGYGMPEASFHKLTTGFYQTNQTSGFSVILPKS